MEVILQNLTKKFPGRGRKNPDEVTAVNDFNFEIPDGSLIGLLGPSGCGKSTTLHLISGLLKPTSGKIFFGEDDVTGLPPENRGIGLVFQNYALYPHLTVKQNILFPLENLKGKDKLSKQEMLEKAQEAARLVQIDGLMERKPGELSGGQQQRVAIARALVKMPRVLLLDEPLSNLDARLRLQTREEIRRIQQDFGMTTIFVTHDQDEAMVMSDVIHLFYQGHIEQSGSPTEMYTQPVSKFAASFIGNYNILTAAEFEKAAGEAVDCADVAIRPEIVRINLEVKDESTRYHMEGKVIDSLSHGNLMRYTILCNGVEINADIMFEKSQLLEIGQQVKLSIRRTNIIQLNH